MGKSHISVPDIRAPTVSKSVDEFRTTKREEARYSLLDRTSLPSAYPTTPRLQIWNLILHSEQMLHTAF